MATHTTLETFVSPLCQQFPIVGALDVPLGVCLARIESNSSPLLEKLALYFRDFLPATLEQTLTATPTTVPTFTITALEAPAPTLAVPLTSKAPDPGKTKIKEEYADLPDGRVVRKRLTGMVFYFGGNTNIAVGPCLSNDNQVINFLNSRLIQQHLDRGSLLAHAAAVAHRSAGLAIAGFAGMGKSTFSLWLLGQGADFVSNDRLLLESGNTATMDPPGPAVAIHGVAKLPRVNPGTVLHNPALQPVIPAADREKFLNIAPNALWNLEHKYDVSISACFGPGRCQLSAVARGIIILNWVREPRPTIIQRVDLAQRRDLLEALMKAPGVFYLPAPNTPTDALAPQRYIDTLRDCPVYEIQGGVRFEATAAHVWHSLITAAGLPQDVGETVTIIASKN